MNGTTRFDYALAGFVVALLLAGPFALACAAGAGQ